MVLKDTITMLVSFRRITAFLNADELEFQNQKQEQNVQEIIKKDPMTLEIKNASFTWEDPDSPQLKNLNISVSPGSLTAIVGVVGSGKSSLLQGTHPIGLSLLKKLRKTENF